MAPTNIYVPGAPSIGKNRRRLSLVGSSVNIVGGDVVGNAGSGFYSGYTLSWGDDFTSLSLVGPGSPNAKYFGTHGYGLGPRGNQTTLGTFYDADPLTTGYNDANRGVTAGLSNMANASSVLTLQARKATAGEQAFFSPTAAGVNGGVRNEIGSMIHTAGAINYFPAAGAPVIVEARLRFSNKAANPAGWHPTFWSLSAAPMIASTGDEWDFEGNSQTPAFNRNVWTGGGVSSSSYGSTGITGVYDGNWHTVTFKFQNGATTELWVDGVQIFAPTVDSNSKLLPSYALLTSHIYNGTFNTETYSQAAWNSTGAKIDCDWIKVWRLSSRPHYKPLAGVADLNVSYNGTGSVVLPSTLSLWGDASVTEYVQAIPHESNDYGMTESSEFTQLPTGVTYNSGTRTISVDFSSQQGNAGRVYLAVQAYTTSGSTCEPLRLCINRGPSIGISSVTTSANSPYDLDLYALCSVGSILPKTISVTGLPTGLSYNSGTGHISGTPTGSGTSTASVTVTNSIGQTVTSNLGFTISTGATPYTAWTGPGWFDASDTSTYTLSGSQVTALANKRSGGGDLTQGGTAANITQVASIQNSRTGIRVVRDISVLNTEPRLVASPTANISTMFQGSNKPFTVIVAFKPTDTNTGFPWTVSSTTDGTNSQTIGLVRRSTTASSVRRQLVTGTPNDVSWGSGEASGTPTVIAIKHTGTAVTVWDTSATTKAADTVAQSTSAFSAANFFALFVGSTLGSGQTFAQTQCNEDFYEIVVDDTARSDADVQQAITDLAAKWGITLS